jgi:hypothetical protein
MPVFRKKTPNRRQINRIVKNYTEHRDDLKQDFNNRCGYCDDHDKFKRANFEIDHFIPKNILKKTYTSPEDYKKKEQEYSNLVYSCKLCNSAKWKHWSSNFIDPCKFEYDEQFERKENGEIKPITELGKWIYKTLKLYEPEHAIFWNLDELDQRIKEIKEKSVKNEKLNKLLDNTKSEFYEFYTKLTEY